MARMIPPYISDDVKSSGERQLFELLLKDPETNKWVVLHSLLINRHVKNLFGEIDFLVIAPGYGVFCLEVKSGSVIRREGLWEFTNRFGKTTTKVRGPFQQAQEAMFSLIESIKKKYGPNSRQSKFVFGYGVMFPHIVYNSSGPEEENWQIYDRDSKRSPISQYIKELSKHNLRKLKTTKWFIEEESILTTYDCNQLVSYLRGDFECIVKPNHQLTDTNDQIDRFTEEQFQCLDQINGNERCLFLGAAGTGKTLIAMESIRRSLFEGKRVFFTCYNTLLGEWLIRQFEKQIVNGDLVVTPFHRFLEKLAISTKEYQNLDSISNEEYFKYELPLLALEAMDSESFVSFDKIIVDEGQDLIRSEYLDILDRLVKGGMAGGNWEIYCDFERQAIFSDLTAEEMIGLIGERASFIRFRLTINCRNTKPIGEQTSLISGFEKPPYLPAKIEGAPVEYHCIC